MVEVPGWVILNFFTSFLLILLLLFQNKTSRLQSGRKYSAILICTLVLLISETVGRIGENNPVSFLFLARFGYFMIFLLDPVDILFAVSYEDCWMDKENSTPRKLFKMAFQIFAIINMIIVSISSIFQLGWFFYFRNGVYYRGQFFLVRAILLMIFIILLLVYTVVFRSDFITEYKNMIMCLPIFALIGSLLQVFLANLDTTYAGISLGCLILFFFFQSNDVNIDYLTGVLNRRGIDIRLDDKIRNSQASGTDFATLMMDLDNFKTINDTFGHGEGDKAIKYMAEILTDSFGREAVVGRFGGDEFLILTDNVSKTELRSIIEEVRKKLAYIRDKRGWAPNVGISCGYEVYFASEKMSRKKFTEIIDTLMYCEKEDHHKAFPIV
ncbi:MAG: GGDEF domain-containing protein [Pseudobutyrivibrio sp.]|nr:GGDEF domain-containing protein [Pseudobutyrivibrio sp.]